MSQGTTKGIPIDTDTSLSANSNALVSSQRAVKTYTDTLVSLSATNIPLTNLATQAEATLVGRASGAGTGVPSALTSTQARAVVGEVQTVTTASDVTTLTLTPSATLTDGIYEAVGSINSGGARFDFFINGDTTASNYRTGAVLSLGSGTGNAYYENTSSVAGPTYDSGTVGFMAFRFVIKNNAVAFTYDGIQVRSDSIGRIYIGSTRHISATTVTSLQFTASVASKILTGSFITLRRVG